MMIKTLQVLGAVAGTLFGLITVVLLGAVLLDKLKVLAHG